MVDIFSRQNRGGKGNLGMFIERNKKICAAGIPTAQPDQSVNNSLKSYSLQDEVDALIGDVVKPLPKIEHKSILNRHKIRDMRNAGIFSEGSELINPPIKTKFQTLINDFKETGYNSYWNKEVGKIPDPVPSLPKGFKIYDAIAGKKTQMSDNLYDIILPVNAVPDRTPISNKPGYQTNHNYCSFNSDAVFGHKSSLDSSGNFVKCCLTNKKIYLGSALKVPISEKQAHFQNSKTSKLGVALTPNNNITCVPEGFAFGKLESSSNISERLRTCEIKTNKELFKKCLEHLNILRNNLNKRFDGPFINKLYRNLNYLDKSKNGWLEKHVIYDQCNIRYIRFNPSLIEPLLQIWNAYNGSQIDYKIFIRVINHREPLPDLPKIEDKSENVVIFDKISDEISNNKKITNEQNRAGIPSGRYLDRDFLLTPKGLCKAERSYLPEETDMKSCLCPSIFTLLGISHRDMYCKRDPTNLRKIFENAGENFHDKKFQDIWEMAKKYHSQEWVCLETFRRSLIEFEIIKENKIT